MAGWGRLETTQAARGVAKRRRVALETDGVARGTRFLGAAPSRRRACVRQCAGAVSGCWCEGRGSGGRGSAVPPLSGGAGTVHAGWAGAWARCVESSPAVRSGYTRRECVSTRPRRCPPRSAEARPDSGGPGAKWCRCSPPLDVAVALPGGWRPGRAEEGRDPGARPPRVACRRQRSKATSQTRLGAARVLESLQLGPSSAQRQVKGMPLWGF